MADVSEERIVGRRVFEAHRVHTSGNRIHTESAIFHALLEQFPNHCVTSTKCDLTKYAEAGHATLMSVEDGPPIILSRDYESTIPDRSLNNEHDSGGILTSRIYFGCYDYIWKELKFRIYIVNAQNSLAVMANDRRTYIVSQPAAHEVAGRSISAAADALIMAVGIWTEKSAEEIWVCDQGSWNKDRQSWLAVRDINFSDIIGDEVRKSAIERDTMGFFDAGEQYKKYGVPWKRGLIFHGPPGNGKTLTIKAIARSLMERSSQPIPALFVRSITSRLLGPQGILRLVFTKARQVAPCLLVFEDIDSMITDEVRSYFFNEVDGLEDNNGILIIGSTNDLEKLDVGLSQRPSRFDRKYSFNLPGLEERLHYCNLWNQKLINTPLALLNDDAQRHVASLTAGFSFAYLKEVYVSALLSLARQPVTEAGELSKDNVEFAMMLEQQVETLRSEMSAQSVHK